jgi:hypothetical protein
MSSAKTAADLLVQLRQPSETLDQTLIRVLTEAQQFKILIDWAHDGRSFRVNALYVELRWHDFWGRATRLFETPADAARAIEQGAVD